MPRVTELRSLEAPDPGYFRIRLVRAGPFVPAKITHAGGLWCCTINGEERTRADNPWAVADMDRVWFYGQRIAESEYDYMLAMKLFAERHQPEHPSANPRKAIDLRLLPPLYQRKKDPWS